MLKTEKLFGKTVLVHGDQHTVNALTIGSALRMQESSKVLFIDTTNCMTPRYIDEFYHKKIPENLEKILISRPGSVFELISFIYKLEKLLSKSNIKVIILSSINSLFFDIHNDEVKQLFPEMIKNIKYITKKFRTITIIGNYNIPSNNSITINKIISKKIDKIYGV
ncbi:MAG: hypothetical protein V1740_07900 [Candidatus Woesearchaeota archaeon]